jgi:hypothetical protein
MVDNLNATFDEGWLDQAAPVAAEPAEVEEAPVEETPKDEKKK